MDAKTLKQLAYVLATVFLQKKDPIKYSISAIPARNLVEVLMSYDGSKESDTVSQLRHIYNRIISTISDEMEKVKPDMKGPERVPRTKYMFFTRCKSCGNDRECSFEGYCEECRREKGKPDLPPKLENGTIYLRVEGNTFTKKTFITVNSIDEDEKYPTKITFNGPDQEETRVDLYHEYEGHYHGKFVDCVGDLVIIDVYCAKNMDGQYVLKGNYYSNDRVGGISICPCKGVNIFPGET